jgi:hypothetical protein
MKGKNKDLDSEFQRSVRLMRGFFRRFQSMWDIVDWLKTCSAH